ncbi:hypothetical protein Syun_018445 [Stephania yunnanensis]|uniref:Uncharacterized protein n=1 Tax=Stephania yunnanensis TaxID=152371 RepID=A0AAP0ITS4_9MAGN
MYNQTTNPNKKQNSYNTCKTNPTNPTKTLSSIHDTINPITRFHVSIPSFDHIVSFRI